MNNYRKYREEAKQRKIPMQAGIVGEIFKGKMIDDPRCSQLFVLRHGRICFASHPAYALTVPDGSERSQNNSSVTLAKATVEQTKRGAQQWRFEDSTGRVFFAANPRLLLTISNGVVENGTKIQLHQKTKSQQRIKSQGFLFKDEHGLTMSLSAAASE